MDWSHGSDTVTDSSKCNRESLADQHVDEEVDQLQCTDDNPVSARKIPDLIFQFLTCCAGEDSIENSHAMGIYEQKIMTRV